MVAFRYVATALLASAVSFAIAATTGWGHGGIRTHRILTARTGDAVTFVGLDLFCLVNSPDPKHVEAGPVVHCLRQSKPEHSRAIGASKDRYYVTDPSGNRIIYSVGRTP